MQSKSIFFFLKFFYAEKQCGRQFWNAVEREPVKLESSILPRAKRASSETTYSYRKTELKKKLGGFWSGGFCRGDFIREPSTGYMIYHTMRDCDY